MFSFFILGVAFKEKKNKTFAPFGSNFFPLRAVSVLKAMLRKTFLDFIPAVRKNNSVLATPLLQADLTLLQCHTSYTYNFRPF